MRVASALLVALCAASAPSRAAEVRALDPPGAALICGKNGWLRLVYEPRDGKAIWGVNDADGNPVLPKEFRAIDCNQFSDTLRTAREGALNWSCFDARASKPVMCDPWATYSFASTRCHAYFSSDEHENSVQVRRAELDYAIGLRPISPRRLGC